MAALIEPKRKKLWFSVSGEVYDLMNVGIPATKSAKILNDMAMKPSPVSNQSTSARTAIEPHATSSLEIFQYALRFTNDATNIISGPKPAAKVISAGNPTPSLMLALKAMSGASAHRNQVTLLGFVLPLMVAAAYVQLPMRLSNAPRNIKFWLIIYISKRSM